MQNTGQRAFIRPDWIKELINFSNMLKKKIAKVKKI